MLLQNYMLEFLQQNFHHQLFVEVYFIIFRRIWNMQEKIFIQNGRFSFFFRPKLPTLFAPKQMTAVGLGQQGSQAVGSGFESLPCQKFLRFIPNIFRFPKLVKH